MRVLILSAFVASAALAQSEIPQQNLTSGASLAGSNSWTAFQTFTVGEGVTQGQKLCWDAATCSKYLSSDGTSLTLTGLNFKIGSAVYAANASYALLANLQVTNDFTASVEIDTSSNLITANNLHVPVVHGAGTPAQAIESGAVALVAGTATVTFTTAFAAAPICTCADTAGSALACSMNSTSTTQVVIFGTVTDTINYICIGQR